MACSSRSRLTFAARSGGHSIETGTPSAGCVPSATSASSAASETASSRGRSCPACARASVEESARETREPLGLALDVREKAVALGRMILCARLQHLDRADDRRQRRPKLVRRVRDELAFRKLAPLLLGQVVEHDHHRVALGLRRDADERERTLLVGPNVRLGERSTRRRRGSQQIRAARTSTTARAAGRPRRGACRARVAPRYWRTARRAPRRP